jgi:hypothetical protein
VTVSKPDEQQARLVKERHAERLRRFQNVTGVGVGFREVGGRRTNETCVRVYVRRKVAESDLPPDEILPRSLDGTRIDVVEGEFKLMQMGASPLPLEQRVSRHYPFARPGISVGGLRVTAGTLGAVAYDRAGGQQLLLSNWHVLCGAAECAEGEEIVQPGVFDGGTAPSDRIATLLRVAHTVRVDAAVAALVPDRFVDSAAAGLGRVSGVRAAALGERAFKSGRTTGVTSGVVTDVSADLDVEGVVFQDQIVVERDDDSIIVSGGDSGSLVVDGRNRAIGLLFAGRTDGSAWIANQIAEVLEALNIRLTPEPSPLEAFVISES